MTCARLATRRHRSCKLCGVRALPSRASSVPARRQCSTCSGINRPSSRPKVPNPTTPMAFIEPLSDSETPVQPVVTSEKPAGRADAAERSWFARLFARKPKPKPKAPKPRKPRPKRRRRGSGGGGGGSGGGGDGGGGGGGGGDGGGC
jgi:uncharacterized membrane protein YgcG